MGKNEMGKNTMQKHVYQKETPPRLNEIAMPFTLIFSMETLIVRDHE